VATWRIWCLWRPRRRWSSERLRRPWRHIRQWCWSGLGDVYVSEPLPTSRRCDTWLLFPTCLMASRGATAINMASVFQRRVRSHSEVNFPNMLSC
jgi:hypothetical protein